MKGDWLVVAFAIGLPAIAIGSEVPRFGFNPLAAILAFSIGFPLSLFLGASCQFILNKMFVKREKQE